MTELELKEEIEKTRNILNRAVREQRGSRMVLDISRNLDCLIEKYVEVQKQKMAVG